MTLPESHSRFHLPSSVRLLTTPGVRGHSLAFTVLMSIIFVTAYLGRALGSSQAWPLVFALGASTAGTYLTFALLTLLGKTRNLIFHTSLRTRVIILALVFGPIFGGLEYWIQEAGSVEALPIFPAFIVIFYGWILLQAYFIATPVSQLLTRVERAMVGEGHGKKMFRGLGTSVLFLPIAPLVYGVWAISSWLSSTYGNLQDANIKIITWAISITVVLLFTFFLTVRWGWRSIRQNAAQAAIFAGGTFLVLWGYLLYRATMVGIGYVTQNQPSNPLLDAGLVVVSIVGAMQTFARKTIGRADRRWSQLLPFLVFAFGSVYAVAQFYFILQLAITRAALSIVINATVLATGLFTMMFLIRRHVLHPTTLPTPGVQLSAPASSEVGSSEPAVTMSPTGPSSVITGKRSFLRLPWPRRKHKTEPGRGGALEGGVQTEQEQNTGQAIQQQRSQQMEAAEAENLKNEVQEFLDENQQGPPEDEGHPSEQEASESGTVDQNSEESGEPDY